MESYEQRAPQPRNKINWQMVYLPHASSRNYVFRGLVGNSACSSSFFFLFTNIFLLLFSASPFFHFPMLVTSKTKEELLNSLFRFKNRTVFSSQHHTCKKISIMYAVAWRANFFY